jgi:hypothetical protein
MKTEFVTIQEAAKFCKIPVRTCYRLARDLKLMTVMYGRCLVPSDRLPQMRESKRGIGNPNWTKGSKTAAKDGRRGGAARAAVADGRESDRKAPSR